MRFHVGAAALALGGVAVFVNGQSTLDYPVGQRQPYPLDSGLQANPAGVPQVVFQDIVHVDRTAWLRLYFGEVQLVWHQCRDLQLNEVDAALRDVQGHAVVDIAACWKLFCRRGACRQNQQANEKR